MKILTLTGELIDFPRKEMGILELTGPADCLVFREKTKPCFGDFKPANLDCYSCAKRQDCAKEALYEEAEPRRARRA